MSETEVVITRSVPFDLTDAEVALKAKLYADGMIECERELLTIKARAKGETEAVAAKQAALLELRTQCSTRKEHRVVDCYREPDLGARVWRICRIDTRAVVDTQKMTAEEVADLRQLDMLDAIASDKAIAGVSEQPQVDAENDDQDTDGTPEAA